MSITTVKTNMQKHISTPKDSRTEAAQLGLAEIIKISVADMIKNGEVPTLDHLTHAEVADFIKSI